MGFMVREVREELHMTQEELAEKSGISRARISAIENGTAKDVMMSTLLSIAKAMGVTLDKIFTTTV